MTDTTATELSLEVTHHLPFPPDRVFDAWPDPATLAKFMLPAPGMAAPKVTTDPRVGGRFLIVMQTPDADLPHEGEYLVIDRPNRLQFTWISAYTQEDSTVTLEFTPSGAGTDIRLTHVRFPSTESRDNHQGGWGAILRAMDGALA